MKYFAAALGDGKQVVLGRLKDHAIRVLASYYYKHEITLAGTITDDILVDSGAFSAFTRGEQLDLSDYMQFIKDNEYTIYAGLDVIGDPKQSRFNIEIMESEGLNPIPTFHYGDPIEDLHYYCESFNYIAFGGIAKGRSIEETRSFLDTAWRYIVHESPTTKVHGFGVSSFSFVRRYPWYSVDSTTWLVGAMYGALITTKGKQLAITLNRNEAKKFDSHIDTMNDSYAEVFNNDLIEAGFTLEEIRSDNKLLNSCNLLMLTKFIESVPRYGMEHYSKILSYSRGLFE